MTVEAVVLIIVILWIVFKYSQKQDIKRLHGQVVANTKLTSSSAITIQELINYIFTIPGVIAVSSYQTTRENIHVKVADYMTKSEARKIKGKILEYINQHTLSSFVAVSVSTRDGHVKKMGRYITLKEHVRSLR